MVEVTGPINEPIPRFVWSQEGDGEYVCDAICTDRLTGKVVVRYDMGDPANHDPAYGGWSKREYLEHKKLDPDEEIELAAAVVAVPAGEVSRHAAAKRRREQREKEEAEARDLMEFLGDAAETFDFAKWQDHEDSILRPALEARGFKDVGFYMTEEDSFGPLGRGVRAIDPAGNHVRFFYG